MNIQEKFAQGAIAHTYQRIDKEYSSNIYLGYNEQGNMSMVIIEYGQPLQIKSTKLINTEIKKREDGKLSLSFDLVDNAYGSMFTIFCEDMIIECSSVDKTKIIQSSVLKWKYWQELFGKKPSVYLDKADIKGLLGELLFLRDFMMPYYGNHEAIESWRGPLLGHKDFEIKDTWYEVKSINQNAVSVTISSIDQLESDVVGHLEVVTLEDTSKAASKSINLNEVVISILNQLNTREDEEAFMIRLTNIGYVSDPYYDNFAFQFMGFNRYLVSEAFPKIKRDDIDKSIDKVKYSILLNGIESFREVQI